MLGAGSVTRYGRVAAGFRGSGDRGRRGLHEPSQRLRVPGWTRFGRSPVATAGRARWDPVEWPASRHALIRLPRRRSGRSWRGGREDRGFVSWRSRARLTVGIASSVVWCSRASRTVPLSCAAFPLGHSGQTRRRGGVAEAAFHRDPLNRAAGGFQQRPGSGRTLGNTPAITSKSYVDTKSPGHIHDRNSAAWDCRPEIVRNVFRSIGGCLAPTILIIDHAVTSAWRSAAAQGRSGARRPHGEAAASASLRWNS